MKNSLGDLQNHLFAQLERLGDEELKGDNLQEEINRAKAISDIAEQVTAQPERHLLVAAYLELDSEKEHYYNWSNQYNDNETLNKVYDFLEKLGYEMSDEERALRDGTHKLFTEAKE